MSDLASPTTSPAPGPVRTRPSASAEDAATRVFNTSILISASRCLLAYVVFPWLLPVLGMTGGVGPVLGLTIGVVAIGFNAASIRRFHRSGHRWRWTITALNAGVIALLLVTMAQDVADFAS
ncbi:MAG: hypothetical protein AB7H43_05855 [Acidimicrobiia bacterium]